ncbi:hypothetical protein SCORR_v1c01140 [Spiroplasma corruscae]|uniref:Uncharacterized protein n=1 Tax=Spiroplasma corruscae TaxID=216934 RepID=A0A222EN07_9MOLU|nr:hypothetical protein SCORR_v1c01140 [Spiroplasma corruscae]
MNKKLIIPLTITLSCSFILQILTLSLLKFVNINKKNDYLVQLNLWIWIFCILAMAFIITILITILLKKKNTFFVCSILCIIFGIYLSLSFIVVSYYFGVPNIIIGIILLTIGSIYINKNKDNYY